MPTIRAAADFEHCLLEILRAHGGRASRGQVFRDFERRYYSSVPRDLLEARAGGAAVPPWQRELEEAARRLERRRVLAAPDPDRWDLV